MFERDHGDQVDLERRQKQVANQGIEKELALDLFKSFFILLGHAIASEKYDCEKDQKDEDDQDQGSKQECRSKVGEEIFTAHSIISKFFFRDLRVFLVDLKRVHHRFANLQVIKELAQVDSFGLVHENSCVLLVFDLPDSDKDEKLGCVNQDPHGVERLVEH